MVSKGLQLATLADPRTRYNKAYICRQSRKISHLIYENLLKTRKKWNDLFSMEMIMQGMGERKQNKWKKQGKQSFGCPPPSNFGKQTVFRPPKEPKTSQTIPTRGWDLN